MTTPVIDLDKYRRRKLGLRPRLRLIGLSSRLQEVMGAALAAVDAPDREALLVKLSAGSYSEMLLELVNTFEIDELDDATTARVAS
jgi:hypothetical protein